MTNKDRLSLKWGMPKGWHLRSDASLRAAERYMAQDDSEEQKAALCDLIDAIDGEIVHCSGEVMTKAEAKKYVLGYRRR